jgi:hypothetical protein
MLGLPARQWLGLHVQQRDAVAAQGQVVGQLAADQARTHDGHVLGCVTQRGAQAQIRVQVVDEPMGQHQLFIGMFAARGVQGLGASADAGGLRLRQQVHTQPLRDLVHVVLPGKFSPYKQSSKEAPPGSAKVQDRSRPGLQSAHC